MRFLVSSLRFIIVFQFGLRCVVSRRGQVAGQAERLDTDGTRGAAHGIPGAYTARYAIDVEVCPAVTVEITGRRHIGRDTPGRGPHRAVDAVERIPNTGRRAEYRDVGLTVAVVITHHGFVS